MPSLIYAQNNIDDKYEVLSLTDMLNLFENNEKNVLEYYDKIYVRATSMSLLLCILHL